MDTYSSADVSILADLYDGFESFVEVLGLAPDYAVFTLADDEREPLLPPIETEYVIAWALWVAAFRQGQTIAWSIYPVKDGCRIINQVVAMMERLGKFAPGITRRNALGIEFDNGSRIMVRSTSRDAWRGWSISHFIVHNLDPSDRRHEELLAYVAPVLCCGRDSRFITILPS